MHHKSHISVYFINLSKVIFLYFVFSRTMIHHRHFVFLKKDQCTISSQFYNSIDKCNVKCFYLIILTIELSELFFSRMQNVDEQYVCCKSSIDAKLRRNTIFPRFFLYISSAENHRPAFLNPRPQDCWPSFSPHSN